MRPILTFLITQFALAFTYFYSPLSSSCEDTPLTGTVYSAGGTPCFSDTSALFPKEKQRMMVEELAKKDIGEKRCEYIECNNSSNSCTGRTSCEATGRATINQDEGLKFELVDCKTPSNIDGKMVTYTFRSESTNSVSCECRCESLLVKLNSFITEARISERTCFVEIKWETATEIDTIGFNVWRAQVKDGKHINITKVNNQLISTKTEDNYQGAPYSYEDHNITPENTYYYALEDISFSGLSTIHYDFVDSATVQYPLVIDPRSSN